MISQIRIERFKNLQDITLELEEVTVLVGSNNAGKSSVLQALQFATSIAQTLRLDGKANWSGDSSSGTLASEQLVYSPFRDIDGLAHGGTLRQAPERAIRVTMVDDAFGTTMTAVRRGKNKNLSLQREGKVLGEELEPLTTPFMVLTPGLAGIPAAEELRSAGVVRRAAAKGDANSVLRNILLLLKSDPVAWRLFLERLHTVFPALGIGINFDTETDEIIEAHITQGGSKLPLDSSGTGVLQVVQILAYIGLYSPKILLLDEPDSHLHPANQRVLGTLLTKLTSESNLQVILSTHSRHLLDELRSNGAKMHWIDAGFTQDEPVDHIDMLLGLGALDAGDKLRNGQTPWVLLTEDTHTTLVKNVVASNGIDSRDLAIWSYKGCTNLHAAEILSSFIREHAPATQVILHCDRDFRSDETVQLLEDSLEAIGIIPFVTQGTDVESHFLNADVLADHYAGELTVEKAQELIDQATAAAREESMSVFVRARVEEDREERRRTGNRGAPDGWTIAQDCAAEFDGRPEKHRHGKKTLKKLKTLLAAELGTSNFNFTSSEHLHIDSLSRKLVPSSDSNLS